MWSRLHSKSIVSQSVSMIGQLLKHKNVSQTWWNSMQAVEDCHDISIPSVLCMNRAYIHCSDTTLYGCDSITEECTKSLYVIPHLKYIRISRYCRHLALPTPIWMYACWYIAQIQGSAIRPTWTLKLTVPNSEMNFSLPNDIYVALLRSIAGLAGPIGTRPSWTVPAVRVWTS